jgi:outer membrane protein OmpA-like peptidoglycan-associated protein
MTRITQGFGQGRAVHVAGTIGALLVAGCALSAPSSATGAASSASSAGRAATGPVTEVGSVDVPVVGTTTITKGREAGGTRARVLVHGVRRVTGATVLYFSVGLPTGSPEVAWGSMTNTPSDLRWMYGNGGSALGTAVLIDMAGKHTYSVLVDEQSQALASPTAAWPETAGKFYTLYQVLPELPATVTKVDVLIGNSDVVHDVPVENGVLEPALAQTGPLPLGSGWPKIDLAAAANSFRPAESIRKLTRTTSDLKETVVERETPDAVTVDLSADVLFGLDSAELGAEAETTIRAAAEKINAQSDGGRIQVIGYTDNLGSSAHGDVLSKQRAQAVAGVLRPLVSVPGVSYAIEGRGEREPVASNDTEAGRKKNRRVSVAFTPKVEK